MPELPEVETTRRGIAPELTGLRATGVVIRNGRLRHPIPPDLEATLAGQRLEAVERRAKYLLFRFENGSLLVHLGMSGSLRIVAAGLAPEKHDHLDITFGLEDNADIAAVQVQNRASQANARLPSEAISAGITTKKQTPDVLMYLALVSPRGTYDELFLANYATINVVEALKRIKGVGNVSLFGAEFGNARVDVGHVGDAVEVGVLGAREQHGLAVLGGFFVCLVGKVAGHDVAGAAAAHEVHGDARKLQRGAALQKQDAVVVGDAQQAAQGCLGVVDNLLVHARSMAHLEHGHAATAVVHHLVGDLGEHACRQCGRAS